MKKYRIRERVFAILLTLCMVFTMTPANIGAATEGTIGDVGLGVTGIDGTDTITWPLQILDYGNDGMLFEYAGTTGNEEPFPLSDKDGEYVYQPNITIDYGTDFTKDKVLKSHIVNNWFPDWGVSYKQEIDGTTGVKYLNFQPFGSASTELVDFRDADGDGAFDWYGATTNTIGDMTFANAYGYTFYFNDVNGVIEGGDATIIDNETSYNACNPNWANSVQLTPTGNTNEYAVVQVVVNPGSAEKSGITWQTGDLVMVFHSGGSQPGYTNWRDKVAAEALEPGDIVKLSDDKLSATVAIPESEADVDRTGLVEKEKLQYAVLVYRTYDLESTATIEGFLRDANNVKYFGTYGSIEASGDGSTSKWAYTVLDFDYITTSTDEENGVSNILRFDSVAELIKSAGIRFAPTDDDGYELMVSHFAFFSDKGEADAFGEKALVYNYHCAYTLEGPEAEYGADYTTDEMTNSPVVNYWFKDIYKISATEQDGYSTYLQTSDSNTTVKYYQFNKFYNGGTELIDFSTTGYMKREDAKYATLIYRISGLDNGGTIKAFVREKFGDTWGGKSYSNPIEVGTTSDWGFLVFDVTENTSWWDGVPEELYSAGIEFTATNSDDDYKIMVSHFAVFDTISEATVYGRQGVNYDKCYRSPIAYYNPIYNNMGFGLLTGSSDSYINSGVDLLYD